MTGKTASPKNESTDRTPEPELPADPPTKPPSECLSYIAEYLLSKVS